MFWFKNPYKKRLEAFFDWARDIINESECVYVNLPGYSKYFYFEFPLYPNARPFKSGKQPLGMKVAFKISLPQKQNHDQEWIKIFSSPELEISENKNRSHTTEPLRFGLNEEEKKLALKIARDVLEKSLANDERINESAHLKNLPPKFYLKTNLDAALWTNGQLRGSMVIESRLLGEGIAEAAILASRDCRFKPLAHSELKNTRIEITLMSNLQIPLSQNEFKKNQIYSEKGYLLKQNSRIGWYLPQAFNSRKFETLKEFLDSLAEEKAGLTKHSYQYGDVSIFEVEDFIESENHQMVLRLCGPAAKQNLEFKIYDSEFNFRMAADWLCRIQEEDGNFPPITDPFTSRQTQIDWPRLAFTAWALAEFGKTVEEEKYLKSAEKSFDYLSKFLLSTEGLQIVNYDLTLAYFGQLSTSLKKQKEAGLAASKILQRANTKIDTISRAQIVSFLKNWLKNVTTASEAQNYLERLLKNLKDSFEKNLKNNAAMNLAVWAELVNTFSVIDQEFSEKVADWLKAKQLADGAFPESTESNFVYTRGTGKIFEVLALDHAKNKKSLEKALTWLTSMQYDEENTFFIKPEIKQKILGGFRHDYFNHEAWIDAAGHLLLRSSSFVKNVN